MGVCKCKQRNVTNQFCYICRMNVCESCMVKDHERCIIKSYVHWLQDSDYSSTCSLCLEDIKSGDVIRLSCYDLFHWDCINSWALRFPETTAPSFYQCPDCKAPVFPAAALVSPVADVVRQKLSKVAWGRRGLGISTKSNTSHRPQTPVEGDGDPETYTSTPKSSYKPLAAPVIKTPFVPLPKRQQQQIMQQQQQQQLQANSLYSRDTYSNDGNRKVIDTRENDEKINLSYDHDENKYKRKGLFHWIGNLLKLNKSPTTTSTTKKGASLTFKRMLMLILLCVLMFMTMIYFMSTVGRGIADADPQLNPMLNRQIKIGDA